MFFVYSDQINSNGNKMKYNDPCHVFVKLFPSAKRNRLNRWM